MVALFKGTLLVVSLLFIMLDRTVAWPGNRNILLDLKTEQPQIKLMEKNDWRKDSKKENCHSQVVTQSVIIPGCNTKFVKNRYCYGQCNSVYVPQMHSNFKNCKACVPDKLVLKQIKIKCPGKIKNEATYIYRNVTLVKNCLCQDVLCDMR